MSDVSLNFRQNAYFSEENGGIPICLITIDHDDFAAPIRISTDPTERVAEYEDQIVYGTESNGETYLFFPCKLRLPDDTGDGPRNMRIEFDNVHRDYIPTIRSITIAPTMQVDMVMSNALDVVEKTWPEFFLNHVQYNAGTITAVMRVETLETEPFPAVSFLPSTTPNLF